MTTKLIIAICLFAAVLIGKLAVDFQLYQSRKVNEHLLGPVIVFIVLVVCSFLAGWKSAPMWFFGYWAFFDVAYAILIGQKFSYVGETAKLDKLQRKYPALMWAKFIDVPISILFYILLERPA